MRFRLKIENPPGGEYIFLQKRENTHVRPPCSTKKMSHGLAVLHRMFTFAQRKDVFLDDINREFKCRIFCPPFVQRR